MCGMTPTREVKLVLEDSTLPATLPVIADGVALVDDGQHYWDVSVINPCAKTYCNQTDNGHAAERRRKSKDTKFRFIVQHAFHSNVFVPIIFESTGYIDYIARKFFKKIARLGADNLNLDYQQTLKYIIDRLSIS